jgi:hypothetical protein
MLAVMLLVSAAPALANFVVMVVLPRTTTAAAAAETIDDLTEPLLHSGEMTGSAFRT